MEEEKLSVKYAGAVKISSPGEDKWGDWIWIPLPKGVVKLTEAIFTLPPDHKPTEGALDVVVAEFGWIFPFPPCGAGVYHLLLGEPQIKDMAEYLPKVSGVKVRIKTQYPFKALLELKCEVEKLEDVDAATILDYHLTEIRVLLKEVVEMLHNASKFAQPYWEKIEPIWEQYLKQFEAPPPQKAFGPIDHPYGLQLKKELEAILKEGIPKTKLIPVNAPIDKEAAKPTFESLGVMVFEYKGTGDAVMVDKLPIWMAQLGYVDAAKADESLVWKATDMPLWAKNYDCIMSDGDHQPLLEVAKKLKSIWEQLGYKEKPEGLFAKWGVKALKVSNPEDLAYGKELKPEQIVSFVKMPNQAKGKPPDEQIIIKAELEPEWAGYWLCVFEDGHEEKLSDFIEWAVNIPKAIKAPPPSDAKKLKIIALPVVLKPVDELSKEEIGVLKKQALDAALKVMEGKVINRVVELLEKKMKNSGFKYFTIEGLKHKYIYPKGVLMHFKQSWKGKQLKRLVEWGLANLQDASKVTTWFIGDTAVGSNLASWLVVFKIHAEDELKKGGGHGSKATHKPKPKKKAPQGKPSSGKKH